MKKSLMSVLLAVALSSTGVSGVAFASSKEPENVSDIRATVENEGEARVAVTTVTPAGIPEIDTVNVTPENVDETLSALVADPDVSTIQEDVKVKAHEKVYESSMLPQWEHAKNHLDASAVWKQSTGSGVKIAVIDSGVDAAHPELAGQVLKGKDWVDSSKDGRTDPRGHGTHVAGIIAASNNGYGTTGLAYGAKILPLRVLGSNGSGYASDVFDAVKYAADQGANIINMSLGGEDYFDFEEAVNYARSKGILVIASNGNSGHIVNKRTVSHYPAATPGVIGVGATNDKQKRANFSTYNEHADISAPGENILSTWPELSWVYADGTSMAAPYASATYALALSKLRQTIPGATASKIESVVHKTADDKGSKGKDHEFGDGIINPVAALNQLTPTYAMTLNRATTKTNVTATVTGKIQGANIGNGHKVTVTVTPVGKKAYSRAVVFAGTQGKLTLNIRRTTTFRTHGVPAKTVQFTPTLTVGTKKRTLRIKSNSDHNTKIVIKRGKRIVKRLTIKQGKTVAYKAAKGRYTVTQLKSAQNLQVNKSARIK